MKPFVAAKTFGGLLCTKHSSQPKTSCDHLKLVETSFGIHVFKVFDQNHSSVPSRVRSFSVREAHALRAVARGAC